LISLEANFGDGIYSKLLQPHLMAHQRYQLFFQMTRITRDKGALAKDDRIEALAMAVGYWAERLLQHLLAPRWAGNGPDARQSGEATQVVRVVEPR
jgi:hypothetical protein